MKNKHTPLLLHCAAAFLGITTVVTVGYTGATSARVIDAVPSTQPTIIHLAAPVDVPTIKPSRLSVSAFQRRLERAFGIHLNEQDAEAAMLSRQILLKMKLSVEFNVMSPVADSGAVAPLHVSVQEHEDWIKTVTNTNSVSFALDQEKMQQDLETSLATVLPTPSWGRVSDETSDAFGNVRLSASGAVRSGYNVDIHAVTTDIVQALTRGSETMAVPLVYDPGGVIRTNPDGTETRYLRLSEGRSNYAHSPWGRIANIHKALAQQLNGVMVQSGVTFHFNNVLKGAGHWEEALGIFEGGALRPVAGGGICQAATTLYRAIVKAGLPVVDRANHSLYVTYYKAYGVGIDATVFPGAQDLSFVNDTGHPMIILAHYEGDDAFVDMFGTPDGRQVTLTGPYFASTAPVGFTVDGGRSLRGNEIAWQQTITWPDGRSSHNEIVSTYRSLPSSLAKENITLGNAATL
jgi:vancomycin resistance protein YoaR